MNAVALRLAASFSCAFLITTWLPAAEGDSDRPASPVFLAAALTGERTVDVRASEATTVEIINAVRDAFNDGAGVRGSISVAPTIRRAFFKGAEIKSQIVLRVAGSRLTLQPSSGLNFGIVRAAATHLSKIDSIDEVYIVGLGPFSPPSDVADQDPFDTGRDPFGHVSTLEKP